MCFRLRALRLLHFRHGKWFWSGPTMEGCTGADSAWFSNVQVKVVRRGLAVINKFKRKTFVPCF